MLQVRTYSFGLSPGWSAAAACAFPAYRSAIFWSPDFR